MTADEKDKLVIEMGLDIARRYSWDPYKEIFYHIVLDVNFRPKEDVLLCRKMIEMGLMKELSTDGARVFSCVFSKYARDVLRPILRL